MEGSVFREFGKFFDFHPGAGLGIGLWVFGVVG